MPQTANGKPRILPDTPENGKILREIRAGSWQLGWHDAHPTVASEMETVESGYAHVLPDIVTADKKLDVREAVWIVERANPKTHPHSNQVEDQAKAYALGQKFLKDNGVIQDQLGVYHDTKNHNQEIIVPNVQKAPSPNVGQTH